MVFCKARICHFFDVIEREIIVHCDIALSVERDETPLALAELDNEKAGSLRMMIAIRPREIEAFPFQNEGYKQLSL